MEETKHTRSGYPAGMRLKDSYGNLYEVKSTGQIVRERPKMSKAELKRHKKLRQQGKKNP